jgi:hypothetical protein
VWIDPPELGIDREDQAWPCGLQILDEDLTNNAWRRASHPGSALHRTLRAMLQAQSELTFAGLIG